MIGQLTKNVYGKIFAGKGYISQKLMEELLENGIELITNLVSGLVAYSFLPKKPPIQFGTTISA